MPSLDPINLKFIKHIQNNDFEAAEKVLEKGAYKNIKLESGEYLLEDVALKGNFFAVAWLVLYDADVNIFTKGPNSEALLSAVLRKADKAITKAEQTSFLAIAERLKSAGALTTEQYFNQESEAEQSLSLRVNIFGAYKFEPIGGKWIHALTEEEEKNLTNFRKEHAEYYRKLFPPEFFIQLVPKEHGLVFRNYEAVENIYQQKDHASREKISDAMEYLNTRKPVFDAAAKNNFKEAINLLTAIDAIEQQRGIPVDFNSIAVHHGPPESGLPKTVKKITGQGLA